METKYKNLAIFSVLFFHFFAIENLQSHLFYLFWISLFGKISPIQKKGCSVDRIGGNVLQANVSAISFKGHKLVQPNRLKEQFSKQNLSRNEDFKIIGE
jgi:hypothetical protein